MGGVLSLNLESLHLERGIWEVRASRHPKAFPEGRGGHKKGVLERDRVPDLGTQPTGQPWAAPRLNPQPGGSFDLAPRSQETMVRNHIPAVRPGSPSCTREMNLAGSGGPPFPSEGCQRRRGVPGAAGGRARLIRFQPLRPGPGPLGRLRWCARNGALASAAPPLPRPGPRGSLKLPLGIWQTVAQPAWQHLRLSLQFSSETQAFVQFTSPSSSGHTPGFSAPAPGRWTGSGGPGQALRGCPPRV